MPSFGVPTLRQDRQSRAASALLVEPAAIDPGVAELATALSPEIRLGTASWNYPGWAGMVWARNCPEASLSRYGLAADARHPLFRTVSVD